MNLKTNEMFDILRFLNDSKEDEFPPCIHELKMALKNIQKFENMQVKMADSMKKQIVDRLLLPGISTKFIINFYIQITRVFKFIDPTAILLELISEPIKKYLRSRKDTLRCIVHIIISDEKSELYQQFGN